MLIQLSNKNTVFYIKGSYFIFVFVIEPIENEEFRSDLINLVAPLEESCCFAWPSSNNENMSTGKRDNQQDPKRH